MNGEQLLENVVFERQTLIDEFLREVVKWHSLDGCESGVAVIDNAMLTSDDEATAARVTCAWCAVRQ